MRKRIFLVLLPVALVVGIVLLWSRHATESPHPQSPPDNPAVAVDSTPPEPAPSLPQESLPLAKRSQLTNEERLRWLEQNGEVPTDAEIADWQLAQKTSWWGKPLDPEEFWKGKVRWRDHISEAAAKRHGRLWPPMPYPDPSLPSYHDNTHPVDAGSAEGPDIHYTSSAIGEAFWTKAATTLPQPPEQVEDEQFQAAQRILERKYLEQHGSPIPLTPRELAEHLEALKNQALSAGCPKEALSDDALFWAYVMNQRKQYEEFHNSGKTMNEHLLLTDLKVDPKLITEPLTREQLQAANSWKIAYLRRLQQEKVDASYMNAYLHAWNLSSRILSAQ